MLNEMFLCYISTHVTYIILGYYVKRGEIGYHIFCINLLMHICIYCYDDNPIQINEIIIINLMALVILSIFH